MGAFASPTRRTVSALSPVRGRLPLRHLLCFLSGASRASWGSHSQLSRHTLSGFLPSPPLRGCVVFFLQGLQRRLTPGSDGSWGGRMGGGGPGLFPGPWVLDPMASVGRRQLRSVDMTGPPPTPPLGTVGRKQEARSHPETQPSSVSAPGQAGRRAPPTPPPEKTADPPTNVKGRKLGVTPGQSS